VNHRRAKGLGTLALSLVTVMGVATAALAAPHFLRGPTFRDLGTQLRVTGTIAGLGNEDIDVVVDAEGIATVQCRNPGGNVAPGQDTEVDVSGTANDIQVKNGRATFTVITAEPTVGSEACPNRQWVTAAARTSVNQLTLAKRCSADARLNCRGTSLRSRMSLDDMFLGRNEARNRRWWKN
jgi:hypothetical protein